MKKILLLSFVMFALATVAFIFSSCSKPKGQLTGIYEEVNPEATPYGMVQIPRGSFVMGPNDQSAIWATQPSQRDVTVESFWMDITEITNGEYKEFVYWVRDSIARTQLARMEVDVLGVEAEDAKYFRMSDTLREKLKAAEIIIMQREEELKYTRQRAEAAEEKVTLATNRKKKVRVIQGMAMRLYPTPEWTIQPRVSTNGVTQNTILNKNSGSVDFDLVVGASMMLYDLTKPNSKFSQDIGLYVGFGGNNLFKNFYVGPSYKFLDFFHLTAGINIAQYEVLADGWSEGDVLPDGWAIQTTREWKVTAFISLSFDLDFISYIGKK